jgi:hypothetical protein
MLEDSLVKTVVNIRRKQLNIKTAKVTYVQVNFSAFSEQDGIWGFAGYQMIEKRAL